MWKCGWVRADRLIGILLLLQQREQVTASEVALELEVSTAPPAATSKR
jgi:predicted DNA-binding transcriptional regulator YafY